MARAPRRRAVNDILVEIVARAQIVCLAPAPGRRPKRRSKTATERLQVPFLARFYAFLTPLAPAT